MSAADHRDRSLARELAVQFLYQSEAEKLFHYSESHLQSFINHLQVPPHLVATLRQLVRGVFDLLPEIDLGIQNASTNWKLSRMPMVDRNALRLAVYELMATDTPAKVVINEAIELAKKFGSGDSAAFVNGLLDRILKTLHSSEKT